MQNKILFIFLLLTASIRGLSQENQINLSPYLESKTNIYLQPLQGSGDGMTFPVVLNWDKKKNLIQVEFKSNSSDKYIYFFPKMEFFNNVTKREKNLWFSKQIKRNSYQKTVNKYLNKCNNITITEDITRTKFYGLKDPNSNMIFKFNLIE